MNPPLDEFSSHSAMVKEQFQYLSIWPKLDLCHISYIQSTLPKLNLHKLNKPLSRRSIHVVFSLYSIVSNPSLVKFSLSQSYCPRLTKLGRGL